MSNTNLIFTAAAPTQVRQGDVLVTPALMAIKPADIGNLIKEGDGSRIVLAHGEVTGHAHAFYPALDIEDQLANAGFKASEPVKSKSRAAASKPAVRVALHQLANAEQYSGSTLPGQRLLRVTERSLLRHEEHSTISLAPGDYVVIQQHEGNEMEELRKVAD
jgi:hypothetical protein